MRTPPHTPPIEARVEHGFRLDVLRYGPATGFVPEPVDLRILACPREAVRVIRVQLRASHVLGLTPRETARALHWADQGGWVQALGALHRDEPCGFTLLLRRGRHIEWSVRPLRYVSLTPPPGR
ncbi:hypothetical protein OG413_06925 [Streptomyces sp. NBC_01433]|uniref:hypothetical protein n=1 Tax=Streptomyces sp. NBC_01433 TaxID=2903864 RepID=UPI00224CAE09|nr:hypothetical protein [Streptomyces sp. NBC_01433]MCX4675059.1 hypothetical protein [Streptomyces sp. NBC_01433]